MAEKNPKQTQKKNKVLVIKAAWNNKLVLKLISIVLSVGIALSVGLDFYDSNTISSQINTINILKNESGAQAYEALKAEFALTEANLQNATKQLKNAQGNLTNLQVELAQARGNISSLQAQLTKSSADISSLQTQLANATYTVSSLQGQIGTLNQQVSQLQAQISTLAAQSDRLQRLVNTYWVQASGSASSRNGGTSATWVYLYSNDVRYGTPVTSNVYSIRIPNNSTYEIYVQWNSAINEGVCDTGQSFTAQGTQTSYRLNNASC